MGSLLPGWDTDRLEESVGKDSRDLLSPSNRCALQALNKSCRLRRSTQFVRHSCGSVYLGFWSFKRMAAEVR